MSVSRTRLEGLTLAYKAEAEIYPYRIVKLGSVDDRIAQATGPNDALWGVAKVPQGGIYQHGTNPSLQPVTFGNHVDVVLGDIPDVEYGMDLERGDWVTSDAQGRAVKAVTGNQVIGRAAVTASAGALGNVLIDRGVI